MFKSAQTRPNGQRPNCVLSGVVNPDQKQTRIGSLGGRMSQFDQVVEQGKFESLRWRSAGQREADKHKTMGA